MPKLASFPVSAATLTAAVAAGPAWAGPIRVDKVRCLGLENCYRLSNGTVEIVVTTDVGPRIAAYRFAGGANVLAEMPDADPIGEWRLWGGHRLWLAPEAKPRSYSPDNSPVEHRLEGDATIRLVQPVEPATGMQKEMAVRLAARGTAVTIEHRITNRGLWPVDVSPWAMTILRGGGVTVIPQEPFRPHAEALLPARPMAVWHYTNLGDPRLTFGPRYVRVRTDESRAEALKLGFGNKQGWAAYSVGGELFLKRFPYVDAAVYPDYGCNTEVFTQRSFVEVESLGPLRRLEPGAETRHVERWSLFRDVALPAGDDALEALLAPLLESDERP